MWLTLLLNVLKDPTVDSGLISAGEGLVSYIEGLPQEKLDAVNAQIAQLMTTTAAQLSAADADYAATLAELAQLKAQHVAAVKQVLDKLNAQLVARAAPL
jgi:hypothetical protein